jgi:hypothetical protein
MNVTGMLHGSRLLAHVDFPTSEAARRQAFLVVPKRCELDARGHHAQTTALVSRS